MVKFHLIIPPSGYMAQRWKEGALMPPLGILYVAAVLRSAGVEVQITAAEVLKLSERQIIDEVAAFNAPLIGITITTENRFEVIRLIRKLKRHFPEKMIIIGGPHSTMAFRDMLQTVPEIDIAFVGESEKTILELIQWFQQSRRREELKKLKGVAFRIDNSVCFTGRNELITDLDQLPFPAKDLIPIEKYNFRWKVGNSFLPAANMMTSRGCPFNCNFCATPVNWGRKVRGYSPQRVLDEIKWNLENFGAQFIWFYDDTFNYNPQRTRQICELLIKEQLNIVFECELRIDILDYELLKLMKEAGLHYFSFGVEAGSERIRREIIHKQIDTEKIYQVVEWARQLEIENNAFFIFSHPTETWREAQETIAIMEKISKKSEISVAILHIYPGSELEDYARENKILPADFNWAKKDRRIKQLPAAQGEVPLFKENLSWLQIGELILKWSYQSKKVNIWKKIPYLLKSIRSWRDLYIYFLMALAFLKMKFKPK